MYAAWFVNPIVVIMKNDPAKSKQGLKVCKHPAMYAPNTESKNTVYSGHRTTLVRVCKGAGVLTTSHLNDNGVLASWYY